jgi:protein-S-isoprenylcysteine O-methyltransferase Ste14
MEFAMKNILRHLSSFFPPMVMVLILPYLIISYEHQLFEHPVINQNIPILLLGLFFGIIGLVLFVITTRDFILIGNGTIMPWDPTKKLIVIGMYQYVRNPLIISVIGIQFSEAMIFNSYGMTLLAFLFFIINTIYFIFSEEPGLEKRFGEEYIEYRKNVPMWIPRISPWHPIHK